MRVISQDGHINVPYRTNSFYLVKEDNAEQWHIALRTLDFRMYYPLATFDNAEDAEAVFNKMSKAIFRRKFQL